MNTGLLDFPRGLYQDLRLWLVPIGVGMDWWGTEVDCPKGYIVAYGQTVKIGDYPRLFKLWGVTYGGSVATGTFGVPDMRGRMSVGKDNMGGTSASRAVVQITGGTLGSVGGTESVTLTTTHLPASGLSIPSLSYSGSASINSRYDSAGPTLVGNAFTTGPTQVNTAPDVTGGDSAGTLTGSSSGSTGTGTTGVMGSGGAHSNLPPAIICNYIIRAG